MRIVGDMGYLDREDIDPNHAGYQQRALAAERERRYGRAEDDDKRIAPYIGMCPDETEHEEPSPLDFGNDAHRSASSYFSSNLQRWDREERAAKRRHTTLADELGLRRR